MDLRDEVSRNQYALGFGFESNRPQLGNVAVSHQVRTRTLTAAV